MWDRCINTWSGWDNRIALKLWWVRSMLGSICCLFTWRIFCLIVFHLCLVHPHLWLIVFPPAKFSFLPVSDSQTDLVLLHFLCFSNIFFSISEVVASEIPNHLDNFPFCIDFIWNWPLDLTSSGKYTFVFLIFNLGMVYCSHTGRLACVWLNRWA